MAIYKKTVHEMLMAKLQERYEAITKAFEAQALESAYDGWLRDKGNDPSLMVKVEDVGRIRLAVEDFLVVLNEIKSGRSAMKCK